MTDKAYTEASMKAMGRAFAEIFLGLIEGGMTREEALEVICAYVEALAGRDPSSGAAS